MVTRFCTIILLAVTTLLIGCEKEPDNTAIISHWVLDGWEISKSVYDFDINPRDIFFVNSEIGFIVGLNGNIYKTIDSGQTWHKQNSGTSLHLHSVFFLNINIGFAAGQHMSGCLNEDCGKGSVLLKTTNGGDSWIKTFFNDYTKISCLHFFDDSNGLAIIHTPDIPNSRNEYISRTSDGGLNWELIDLAIKPPYDKFFCVDNIVFIAGENQRIFKSIDYGNNWEIIPTPVEACNNVRNIYFYSENIGFMDGITNFYKTLNGGTTWEKVDFPFNYFNVFHFFNEKEGFALERVEVYEGFDFPVFKGTIFYQTDNGGDSWKKSDLITNLYPGLTYFPDRNLGYGINGSEFYIIKKEY